MMRLLKLQLVSHYYSHVIGPQNMGGGGLDEDWVKRVWDGVMKHRELRLSRKLTLCANQTTTNKRKQVEQLWVCFLPTDTC